MLVLYEGCQANGLLHIWSAGDLRCQQWTLHSWGSSWTCLARRIETIWYLPSATNISEMKCGNNLFTEYRLNNTCSASNEKFVASVVEFHSISSTVQIATDLCQSSLCILILLFSYTWELLALHNLQLSELTCSLRCKNFKTKEIADYVFFWINMLVSKYFEMKDWVNVQIVRY